MLKFIGVILVAFCAQLAISQDLNNFSGLKCQGKIPKEFLISSTEKYQADFDENDNDNLDKKFFLSTRYFIDQLLLSGKVLFNEPVSNYVNEVAQYALKTQPDLLEKLQFYVLKSTEVNAFSTDQGIIFFTTGLLAQLDNEAQLAYILLHEVSHFTEKHVQDSYVERNEMIRGKNKYSRMGYDDRINEMSVYKKSNELDADSKGVDMYLETEYKVDEIISSFGVLLYSYLPFEDLSFDTLFFDTEYLKVPSFYFPDTINPITKEEDYDDSRSTHPNIKTRIDNSVEIINDRVSKGDKLFVVSESKFIEIRNLARFEGVQLKLYNRAYIEVIYDLYLLKKDFPENEFLDAAFVKAFYGLSKYKNGGNFSEIRTRLSKVEGESYRLHAAIQKLSKGQLNVMAYRYAYDLVKKYPDNDYYKKFEKDLKNELALNKDFNRKALKRSSYESFADSIQVILEDFDIEDSIRKVEASDLSKYQKIKLKKSLNALFDGAGDEVLSPLADFHYYALYDIVNEDRLIEALQEIAESSSDNNEYLTKIKQNESINIGLDSIIMVEPEYISYSTKGNFEIEKSERLIAEVNRYCAENYEKLDLHKEILSPREMSGLDVDKYNQIGVMNYYLQEKLSHDDIEMISASHQGVLQIKQYYNNNYVLFSQFSIDKYRKTPNILHIYGVLTVFPIPFVIYDLRLRTLINYNVLLIDIEDDDYLYRDQISLKARANKRNLDLMLFHCFKNINSK
ncbi:MAG: M48 family metallopeptidase [Putridiphycobacter sp.]|nr:M48 family metallopeptidase [Putridiphycobacter sp.]